MNAIINREKIAVAPCSAGTTHARVAVALIVMLAVTACAQKQTFDPPALDTAPESVEQQVNAAADAVSDTIAENATDEDNDGVMDALDKCAATQALRPVDEAGCDLFEGKLDAVEFEPDSYVLNAESRLALDKLIVSMKSHPDVVLAISGHTDNRGNARDNLELSKKRVLAVVRYLVLNGINGRRLHPHGYGESRPLFSNATEEGRKRNRRIEITQIQAL